MSTACNPNENYPPNIAAAIAASCLPFACRAVVTSLAANAGTTTGVLTANANGALATQDGVSTLAVGDNVFIQGGTTNLGAAADSGPWQIQSLGSASSKWVFARPSWWTHGAAMTLAQKIQIGGEGTFWAGTKWTSYAAPASAVDTTDPAFYVDEVTQQITLVASAATIANVGIRSASKFSLIFDYTGTGAIAATVGYGQTGAATPGYIGTASIAIAALASGMAKNGTTDVSVVNVTTKNNS